MAKSKLIDTLLLQRFWDGFKDVILKEYLDDELERISNSYL